MARLPRLTLPDHLHHVMQRGNNRQPVFIHSTDYQFFLNLLGECSKRFELTVHAYVLMPNEFHWLGTPQQDNNGIALMMQAVGRRYVRYFNDLYGRSGTLWDGRYRSTIIQAQRHGLECMAYIDLHPVRSGLSISASEYPWSSHAHYVGQRVDALITAPSWMWGLGNTPFAREVAYSELIQHGLSLHQMGLLTESVRTGWVLGDEGFTAAIQKRTDRRVSRAQAGRPSKLSKVILSSSPLDEYSDPN